MTIRESVNDLMAEFLASEESEVEFLLYDWHQTRIITFYKFKRGNTIMGNKAYVKGLVVQFANMAQDAIAFSIYDGQQVIDISYPQFASDILKAEGYFVKNNIHRQHVALLAPNSYEWVVAFFAISLAGNTVVTINPDLPPDLLEEKLTFTDVSTICADHNQYKDEIKVDGITWVTFAELNEFGASEQPFLYDWALDETWIMVSTSGTTGKSKIIEYSIENMFSHFFDLEEIFDDYYNRPLVVAPMHHSIGLFGVLNALYFGFCLCIGRGSLYMMADMPVLNPSYIQTVPATLESIVKLLKNAKTDEERQKYIGKNLKRVTTGGAISNPAICRYLMDMGIVVENGYGMTETTGAGTWCELSENNLTTIGKPYGTTQMRIKDGEIQIKSPGVMKGYYKDPEATAAIIEDGWLHTGDLGYCDKDGYYYITGKKKNVIILSNGENVNPEEVEATFANCDAIEECLVYSDGKGICADVFTRERDTVAAFIKKYNKSMPMYRQVYKVNYTEEPLPKTGSGKIKRKENK